MAQPQRLTARQIRERDYHRSHARIVRGSQAEVCYEVVDSPRRRWWNGYWDMFTYLRGQDLADKRVLVVGCGSGLDALRLAHLGARVSAFDLSVDMLELGREKARKEGLEIEFDEMPAERLTYPDDEFDYAVAVDILHHVDIPCALDEITRVCRPGARLVVDEIYTHSLADRIRNSGFVQRFLYPRMQRFIYQGRKPYITEDERKLTEMDLRAVRERIATTEHFQYFNFIVTRLIPERYHWLNCADKIVLSLLRPLAPWIAGRALVAGVIRK